jgi:hypothetical protein
MAKEGGFMKGGAIMRIKTILLAGVLGLASLMNYGCGVFAGASIGKADPYGKERGYTVQSPIGKDGNQVSQTKKTPSQG